MMNGEIELFELIEAGSQRLSVAPRLASWEAAGSPEQRALQDYLDHIEQLVRPDEHPGPLEALVLEVGLDEGAASVDYGHDLDNYLYPVAHRLGARKLRLVRGAKQPDEVSVLRWGRAAPGFAVVDQTWRHVQAASEHSATSAAWKHDIHGQIAAQVAAPATGEHPVAVELAFRVGPRRNWANLWKPAIDCLGPLVGAGTRRFAPRDDLITELGLHQLVDGQFGHRVELDIWWRHTTG